MTSAGFASGPASPGLFPGRPFARAAGVWLLLACFLLPACGRQAPSEKKIEIEFRQLKVEPRAVSRILTLVSHSRRPGAAELSPALQGLFTYLARTPATSLVTTPAHAHGIWRIERVFILDDCVAVQLSEGHYLETLFFVEYPQGWRLAARIRPQDHL